MIIERTRARHALGYFLVDNPARVDGVTGEQINLANEIAAALPAKKFILRCNGDSLKVVTETQWNASEIGILDSVITAHVNNT